MARRPRIKGTSGIYHIVMRGINKTEVFSDEEDYSKFMSILVEVKEISQFKLYAFCLMNNHFHLMIEENEETIDLIMKRIVCRYVRYYNRKYSRVGPLFQDRFRSECVENDERYKNVLRYINLNPVSAKICKEPEKYSYSSYNLHLSRDVLLDFELTDQLLGDYFEEYHKEKSEGIFIDYDFDKVAVNDDKAKDIIKKTCGVDNPNSFAELPEDVKKATCKKIYKIGIEKKQIIRLTGVTRYRLNKYLYE